MHAARALHEHPSPETLAEFKHQQFLSSITPFIFGTCVFAVLAGATLGMAALRHYFSARQSSRVVELPQPQPTPSEQPQA